MTIKLTVIRSECVLDVEVAFVHWPAHRGQREAGTGLQLSPDDPAEMELLYARDADTGREIELTRDEEAEAEQMAWDKLAEERQAALEARADAWEDR